MSSLHHSLKIKHSTKREFLNLEICNRNFRISEQYRKNVVILCSSWISQIWLCRNRGWRICHTVIMQRLAVHQTSYSHLHGHQKMINTCFCFLPVFARYPFITSMTQPKVFKKEREKRKLESTYVGQQGKYFSCRILILTQSTNGTFLYIILAMLVFFHCD